MFPLSGDRARCDLLSLGSYHTPRAVVAARVPAGQRVDLDAGPRVRSVDEAAVADVDADVSATVEEDEVAGPQPRARHAAADGEVGVGAVRQVDTEVRVDEAHEAGAIEAG